MSLLISTAMILGLNAPPTDAELLERAQTSESLVTRCRAMDALGQRGYWIDRPPAETKAVLDESPTELREFMREAWPWLLPSRRLRAERRRQQQSGK